MARKKWDVTFLLHPAPGRKRHRERRLALVARGPENNLTFSARTRLASPSVQSGLDMNAVVALKPFMRFLLTAMVLGCCVASCQCAAEEPAPVDAAKPAPTFKDGPIFTVTAECQIVTLPQKAALKLLPDLIDERKIDAAYDRLQAMLLANQADLVGNLIVKTQEGVKAESQSIDELSFPTEWDPPNLPDLKDVPKADMAAIVKNWPVAGYQPTAFETRNLGPHLDFTPLTHSPDGRVFEVAVEVNDVRILRVDFFSAGVTPASPRREKRWEWRNPSSTRSGTPPPCACKTASEPFLERTRFRGTRD